MTIARFVRIEKTASARETPPLILATAIIKGPRMDFIVEKAAELGVTELWPMLCARSVAARTRRRTHGQMATARDGSREAKPDPAAAGAP